MLGCSAMRMKVDLSELGFTDNFRITNMWTGGEVEADNRILAEQFPPHASGLYKIEPLK